MADYVLTQTGQEVQDILDGAPYLPTVGGNITGALTVQNVPVLTGSPTAVTPTRNTTNVTDVYSGTRFLRQGNIVYVSLQIQLKAGLTNGNVLYSGLPKPYGGPVALALNCSGGNGYRATINNNGELVCYGSFNSAQDAYTGNVSYITNE